MPGGRPKSDEKERFLAKVKVVESGCHEWQSTMHRDGYGKFQLDGKTVQAHRVAYGFFVNPIPQKAWILHKCDNRKCVNPNHLFIGNSAKNVRDMDEKNRRGTKSQLTYADVNEIKLFLEQGCTQREIALQFGVHQTAISRIKLGKTSLFRKEQ